MAEPGALDPLLDESPLPFGAPDFARIDSDSFLPAFRTAIAAAEHVGGGEDRTGRGCAHEPGPRTRHAASPCRR